MPIDRCRICGRAFFEQPLLRYENMPKAAQFLPTAETLDGERGVALEVCQCSGCGLVQLSNGPVPYYREVVRAAAYSEEMKGFRQQQFGELVRKYSLRGKKVLEIGCGRGEYLSLMAETGANAYGLEYAEESAARCAAEGMKVFRGFMERGQPRLPAAPFDAFFSLNFLEHIPDLNTALAKIGENLTGDAVGLVEVPNFDMILRCKLFSEFIGDHLFYFTADTLTSTLRLNGFEIVECGVAWHDYIISAVVKKRTPLDISAFREQQEQLKTHVAEYVRRFGAGRVAVWGAGHQALAVLSLLDLSAKIRYVVDSAPFKQGKYTPATHLPIVPPAVLRTDPVDAVIVMAASYSDEVAGVLRRNFDQNLSVAILRDSQLEIV
jgi:cyclopropane fatty-acyl-phospholipid synthase-like methyltransferase